MNSEEGTSLAKMAVAVLLVVLVIGAVVAIVYKAYSWFNSGSDKLSAQVNSIDSSAYSSYDDKQCAGTDVLTCLKTYRDSDMAILIANAQINNGADKSALVRSGKGVKCCNYCALVDGANANQQDTSFEYTLGEVGSDGKYYVDDLQWSDNGMAEHNTNFSPTTNKSIKSTYVKQGAEFYSKLVYSKATGEVCGIVFGQLSQ